MGCVAAYRVHNGPLAKTTGRAGRAAFVMTESLLCAAGVAIITAFVAVVVTYSPASVFGDSMEPTLHDGDQVIVRYGAREISRGDVVVLEDVAPPPTLAAKRVVAVAGDRVDIVGDHAVVNGVPEPRHGVATTARGYPRMSYRIPKGYIYVLGDNRLNSLDSRMLGPLPASAVRGVVDFAIGAGGLPRGLAAR